MFTEFMGLRPKVRRFVDDAPSRGEQDGSPIERLPAPRRSVRKAEGGFEASEADLDNCSMADREVLALST